MNIKKVAALQKVGGVLNIAGPPVYVPKRCVRLCPVHVFCLQRQLIFVIFSCVSI